MFISTSFVIVLITSIAQCLDIAVQFPSFPVDTDIGTCTCDLTPGQCDFSCCCDSECSSDQDAFLCSSRDNRYTNSTPVISTVQPTCFKNISIFRSNSPYIIQKMGELVCIDYERYKGSQYYQKPTVQSVSANNFLQTSNTNNGVFSTFAVSNDPGSYQVGTPVLGDTTNVIGTIYSLPVSLLNNPLCSGSQPITYMNNFFSKCTQIVNNATCYGALNPATFNTLCFSQSPSALNVRICNTVTAPAPTYSGSTCTNALTSVIVTIYYDNPTGITNLTVAYISGSATGYVEQTYAVQFIRNGRTPPSTLSNPGYLPGAPIAIGIGNGSTVDTITSSTFSLIRPLNTGFCDTTSTSTSRTPILFGENIRSSCKYTVTTSCAGTINLFVPSGSTGLYVAAYANSLPSNLTRDWLPVIICASEVGKLNTRSCRISNISSTPTQWCYTRLDIQIAYTNIGSISNPQSVLSAIIFHYQYVTGLTGDQTLTQSVTFQNISTGPVVIQGQIPAPNTRLPANFLYPFATGHGIQLKTFSPIFSLFISLLILFL